jgi:elongator complex protein 6
VDGLTGLFLPTSAGRAEENVLSSPDLTTVSGEIQRSIQNLKDFDGGGKLILIIDQLDLLLAAGGDQITAVSIRDKLIGLREVCNT